MQNQDSQNKSGNEKTENSLTKPDPETKNTTDPQEHMQGPISSLMQNAEESFEPEDSAKEKKNDNKE